MEEASGERYVILVGTMTGAAELASQEISRVLEESGARVETVDMEGATSSVFEEEARFVICTSTYGQGDVPDNAREFYEELGRTRPDLSGIRFAVFGLGDMTYADTFCNGGMRFYELLKELGGRSAGEPHRHDASGSELPEEAAEEWARTLSGLFEGEAV